MHFEPDEPAQSVNGKCGNRFVKRASIETTNAVRGAILTALCGVFAALVGGHLAGPASYDFLYLLKPTVVPGEAVIVYMDDDSHRILGQPWMKGWDRRQHARLIDRLKALGAKAIVFDVLFDLPGIEDPEGDRELIRAAASAGNVLVAGKMDPILVNGEIIGMKPTPPFDELRKVTGWGLVEAGDAQQVVRQPVPSNQRVDSLAVETLRHVEPERESGIRAGGWISYYGPPGTIPWVSYHQVFDDKAVMPSAISNKVVFVGALFNVGFTGGRGTDDFVTPYSRWTNRKSPGVEVNATSFLNLLRGDSLRQPPPMIELAIVLLAGTCLGGPLAVMRPTRALLLGLGAGVAVYLGAGLLVWKVHVWFTWLIIGAVQMPTAVIWSVLSGTQRLQREKMQLEESLVTAHAAAAPLVVHFSVTSPTTVTRGSMFPIDVWAHTEEQRDIVLRRASENENNTDTGFLTSPDKPGIPMTVRLRLFDLEVPDAEEVIHWNGQIRKTVFLVKVPDDARHGKKVGIATVTVDGLRVAMVHVGIEVGAVSSTASKLVGHAAQPRRAFACYSSLDRDEVLARIQGMQKVVPELDVFLDVHSLRSGQDWEKEVVRAIESSDVFYLFWSANARKSAEVDKEWRMALKFKGREFINPIPLVSPCDVPPPVELADKHFNDWTLAFKRNKSR